MNDHDTPQANKPPASQQTSNNTSKPESSPTSSSANPKPKGNPAFRAIGLPNWRLRLPSRNWTIFLTITGSFAAAVTYDRRQKKAIQKKWCTLVEHVAQESLPSTGLARRVTIVLAAPPGDGIRVTREHFTEYIKPILVAGALDWDVIEGRREGEVRAGLAERIRRLRRKHGEQGKEPVERDVATAIEDVRERNGIDDYHGQKGDIVIGRHTWKEYIRGLHEGWLGPIDAPAPASEPTSNSSESDNDSTLRPENSTQPVENASAATDTTSPTSDSKTEKKPPEKPAKPTVEPPFNFPPSYSESPLPHSCPDQFQASIPIALPHLLGIRNTPIRIHRFLTRRHLADQVGRQTAAAVLAAYRPYNHSSNSLATSIGTHEANNDVFAYPTQPANDYWEQQDILAKEEPEWYKTARKRKEGEGERVWLDPMVVDARIGERMRKFELEPIEEERARRIAKDGTRVSRPADGSGDSVDNDDHSSSSVETR